MSLDLLRKIADLGVDDALEMEYMVATMEAQNVGEINRRISAAGAGGAAIVIRNALVSRLVILVSRAYSNPRPGDLHIARAFQLLRDDPGLRAEVAGLGTAQALVDAEARWSQCVGDHRHTALKSFRDKQTVHRGEAFNAPSPRYRDVFGLSLATGESARLLAVSVGLDLSDLPAQRADIERSAKIFWSHWRGNVAEAASPAQCVQ